MANNRKTENNNQDKMKNEITIRDIISQVILLDRLGGIHPTDNRHTNLRILKNMNSAVNPQLVEEAYRDNEALIQQIYNERISYRISKEEMMLTPWNNINNQIIDKIHIGQAAGPFNIPVYIDPTFPILKMLITGSIDSGKTLTVLNYLYNILNGNFQKNITIYIIDSKRDYTGLKLLAPDKVVVYRISGKGKSDYRSNILSPEPGVDFYDNLNYLTDNLQCYYWLQSPAADIIRTGAAYLKENGYSVSAHSLLNLLSNKYLFEQRTGVLVKTEIFNTARDRLSAIINSFDSILNCETGISFDYLKNNFTIVVFDVSGLSQVDLGFFTSNIATRLFLYQQAN